jgi:plasmid stabilization system protein ParE
VRIIWLRAAERNLEEQLEYIGERNPRMAATLADKIAAGVARLADHPRSGRPGRVVGTRELVVLLPINTVAEARRRPNAVLGFDLAFKRRSVQIRGQFQEKAQTLPHQGTLHISKPSRRLYVQPGILHKNLL